MAQAAIGIVLIMQYPELQSAQINQAIDDCASRKPSQCRKRARSAAIPSVPLAANLRRQISTNEESVRLHKVLTASPSN